MIKINKYEDKWEYWYNRSEGKWFAKNLFDNKTIWQYHKDELLFTMLNYYHILEHNLNGVGYSINYV